LLALMTISISLFQSCTKGYFDLDAIAEGEINPNLAVPLVNSSLTLMDIIGELDSSGLLFVDTDNFITIINYRSSFVRGEGKMVSI